MLGVACLAFAKFPYYQLYFFRLYMLIVVLGLVNGLILLPVVLSLIGPNAFDFKTQYMSERDCNNKSNNNHHNSGNKANNKLSANTKSARRVLREKIRRPSASIPSVSAGGGRNDGTGGEPNSPGMYTMALCRQHANASAHWTEPP